jgi:hypothetical protein
MKWVDLVSRSMINQMELNLWPVRGRPTIKYILMSFCFQTGILRGYNNPACLIWSAFTLRHVSHSATQRTVSHFIRVHQNCAFKSWYIFVPSEWMEYLEVWASSNIFLRNPWFFGTTKWSLNQRVSCSSTRKQLTFRVTFSQHPLNVCDFRIDALSCNDFSSQHRGEGHIILSHDRGYSNTRFLPRDTANMQVVAASFAAQDICNHIHLIGMIVNLKIIILDQLQPSPLPHVQIVLSEKYFKLLWSVNIWATFLRR